MISYLQIEGLTKSYGDRLLFADMTMGIYEGDKIGLVAHNGAGKSTLLSIIAGHEDYDSGRVVFRDGLRVGYLEQYPHYDPKKSIIANALPSVRGQEDWTLEERAQSLLGLFGIHDIQREAGTLSGGQVKRVAIVRLLLEEPDMMILDEPTNHLDIEMIEWLENYLTRHRVTLLMVTHDRYFLDKVCNKIIEIDRQEIFTYQGNYDYYLEKRQERRDALEGELSKVKNLLRTELEWMRRQPQARGSKAKYRIDNFHQLEKKANINLKESSVKLDVKSSYIGNKIFEAHHIAKSFGDKVILRDFSYTFARYEKVGIVGGNGVGKSTFIKLLLGQLTPDHGHFDIGQTVRWGYYSQDGMTDFDENKKVIDAVREITDSVYIDERTRLTASQFLSHFLFSPADQQKYIYKLSGGERRRLYLATILMSNPNFLILDEPTNDLDIVTLTVLEDYLTKFHGCVIVVSHDRFFLDRIVDHLFVFTGDGTVRDFPGDYSTYRHCAKMEEAETKKANNDDSSRPAPKKTRTESKPRLTFKEKKEKEAIEKQLPLLEKEKSELENAMSSGNMDHESIAKAAVRIQELITLIDESEFRLLELMDKED